MLRKSKIYIDAINSVPEHIQPGHTGDTMSKLFDFLVSTNVTTKGLQIIENFVCAALYMVVVMENTRVDGLLDIPDDTIKMLEKAGQ